MSVRPLPLRAAVPLVAAALALVTAASTAAAAPAAPRGGSVACADPAAVGPSWPLADLPAAAAGYEQRLGYDTVAGLSQGRDQLVAILDTAGPEGDCDGRGTALATLVVGGPDRADGTNAIAVRGLAPAADVLPLGVTARAGTPADPGTVAAALDSAVAAGATVVVVGVLTVDDAALAAAVDRALAAGVPVVAAAGDGDADPGSTQPAAHPGVIAVAASGPQDSASPVHAAGRLTVAAPEIGTLGSAGSAALVGATVADLMARFPGLSPVDVRERLAVTADRPPAAVPDPSLGWGVVNPVAALTAAWSSAGDGAMPSERADGLLVALPPEDVGATWAIWAALGLAAVAGAVAAVAAGARRARRRHWRPADSFSPAEDPAQASEGDLAGSPRGRHWP